MLKNWEFDNKLILVLFVVATIGLAYRYKDSLAETAKSAVARAEKTFGSSRKKPSEPDRSNNRATDVAAGRYGRRHAICQQSFRQGSGTRVLAWDSSGRSWIVVP